MVQLPNVCRVGKHMLFDTSRHIVETVQDTDTSIYLVTMETGKSIGSLIRSIKRDNADKF